MNIGYIGPFYDATGYSHAAIRTVLALDAAGANVQPVNIKLANQTFEPPARLKELFDTRNYDRFDVVVQNTLPPGLQYRHGFKNVGYSFFETTNFRPSKWQYNLELMDELLVSSEQNAECVKESVSTDIPIHVVPIPTDFNQYDYNLDKVKFPESNAFTFYTISDYSSRKNIQALIKAYLTEFSSTDNVRFILKCYVESKNSKESQQIIQNDIQNIKNALRKNDFPSIYLITPYLQTELIERLHLTGDCFVSAERGAAWNIPAFDAMMYGNQVVVNGWGGQTQFVKGNGTYLLDYTLSPVEGMVFCPYKTIYTCYEDWADPHIHSITKSMRLAYVNRERYSRKNLIDYRRDLLQEFDLKPAGEKILEALSD